jgi:metal-responsive CopG/Arc/MetJ family transcriptional regulator
VAPPVSKQRLEGGFQRVGMSLSKDCLGRLDRMCRALGQRSRSAVVEQAVRLMEDKNAALIKRAERETKR